MKIYNFKKVFLVFKKNYQPIPLEIFGKDPYKTLISTLLSSRTKDEVTLKAAERLFEKAPNIKMLDNLSQSIITNLIYPVGFYKTKAKHIKKLTTMILNNFNGEIPANREELMNLPGVGRKTANLVLNRAFSIPAIAVDTHVHQISNFLGWVKTNKPEETERKLINILPKKYWSDTNRLFVSIGKNHYSKKKLLAFLKKEDLII